MGADAVAAVREVYELLRAAEQRHWALLQTALRGETYSPNKLLASAEEVRQCHAKLMALGESLFQRPTP